MSETKYIAYYAATASVAVSFTADVDNLDTDEAQDALRDAAEKAFQETANTTLCHQCAHHMDIGDFELGDSDGAIEVQS